MNHYSSPKDEDSTWWTWIQYDDIGKCIELGALYDDALKKDKQFTAYAVMLAKRIIEDLELPCKASYGKWGARLQISSNLPYPNSELEDCATKIINHPSWKGLKLSTKVFTDGATRA